MSYRILIVDDDREAARMLELSFEALDADYTTMHILSGEEALLEMRMLDYDLLITDYRLPGITGVELIERVRKVDADIPIILASGQAINPIRREVEASGHEVADIFQKPFDVGLIIARVNYLLLGDEDGAHFVRHTQPAAMPQMDSPAEERPVREHLVVDERALFGRLDALQRELSATAAAVVDHEGNVISLAGMLDQSLRFTRLAALLAQNFATADEIAEHLGGVQGLRALHYYSGTDYDIYALPADESYFMALVIPADGNTQMGIVLRFARPVLRDLRAMLGGAGARAVVDEAEESYPEEPVVGVPDTGPLYLEVDSDTDEFIFRTAEDREREEAARAAAAAEEEEAWLAEDTASLDDFFQPSDTAEMVDLDLAALDDAISENADADDFWSEAADVDDDTGGYSMSGALDDYD